MDAFTLLEEEGEEDRVRPGFHHIEEDEDEMWKQARRVFDDGELEELGTRMQARKEEPLRQPTL